MKFTNRNIIYQRWLRLVKRNGNFARFLVISIIIITVFILLKKEEQSKNTLLTNLNVIFHLDLKGAPPKLSYLASVVENLKKYGVNGVLIEYEDMFPYYGQLRNLSAPHAYDPRELKTFLRSVVHLGIEIIPLIQTFGHMEFALKHEEFSHLSEHPKTLDSICPSRPGSSDLIRSMLEQIIDFHKPISPIKYIHIGCDEVFHINNCFDCRKRNKEDLYLFASHVKQVCDTVHAFSPDTPILIWDDMMRGENRQRMLNHPISLPIEPVIWNYLTTDNLVKPIDLYNYNKVFGKMWIASAYKGADGSTATFPILKNRFINHYSWLTRLVKTLHPPISEFRGIILTGWSRYNHYLPTCELLPVSMPSLIINLSLIKLFQTRTDLDTSKDWEDFYFTYLHDDMKNAVDCDLKDIFSKDEPLVCSSTEDLVMTLKRLDDYILWSNETKLVDNIKLYGVLSDLQRNMREWYDDDVIKQYVNEKNKIIYDNL